MRVPVTREVFSAPMGKGADRAVHRDFAEQSVGGVLDLGGELSDGSACRRRASRGVTSQTRLER